MRRYRQVTGTARVLLAILATVREDAGLSYRAVARLSGRTHSEICQWEHAKTEPGIDALIAWAGALGYEVALLPIETTPTEEIR